MTYKKLKNYHTAGKRERAEIEQYIYGIDDPQTRDMFYLHFISGYSYSQTAKHLGGGMTKDCVFARVKRFLENVDDKND
jgi:DNA-directed RNA polymerase specialized sigma24 family protein